MTSTTQRDLHGNTIPIDPHDERTLLFVSDYTKNLARQIKVLYGIDMMDLVEVGIKAVGSVLQETDISKATIETIQGSKDMQEIINLLKNAFDYLK